MAVSSSQGLSCARLPRGPQLKAVKRLLSVVKNLLNVAYSSFTIVVTLLRVALKLGWVVVLLLKAAR
eukprot:12389582-Alexandrium_andersonii.AAC.1